MSLIDATLSLIDEDQGVCPEGHDCALHIGSGHRDIASRVCDTPHREWHEPYRGDPLTRWGITIEEIDDAERRGADPVMVARAREYLREVMALGGF